MNAKVDRVTTEVHAQMVLTITTVCVHQRGLGPTVRQVIYAILIVTTSIPFLLRISLKYYFSIFTCLLDLELLNLSLTLYTF